MKTKTATKIGRQPKRLGQIITLPSESVQDYWIHTKFLGGKSSAFRFYGTQAEASRRAKAASKCHHAISSVAYPAKKTK